MKKSYILFFFLVLTIPVFLFINAWHSNECGVVRKDIRQLEKAQEDRIEENKTVANEIFNLLTVARLETDAQKRLGLKKMRPEDVMLIIMGGKGRGN
jgi:hypothetical protein